MVSTASAQLSITTNPSGPQVVSTGDKLTVELNYSWASTTTNLSGAEISVIIPEIFGGTLPEDFEALTINPQIESVTFDTMSRL